MGFLGAVGVVGLGGGGGVTVIALAAGELVATEIVPIGAVRSGNRKCLHLGLGAVRLGFLGAVGVVTLGGGGGVTAPLIAGELVVTEVVLSSVRAVRVGFLGAEGVGALGGGGGVTVITLTAGELEAAAETASSAA